MPKKRQREHIPSTSSSEGYPHRKRHHRCYSSSSSSSSSSTFSSPTSGTHQQMVSHLTAFSKARKAHPEDTEFMTDSQYQPVLAPHQLSQAKRLHRMPHTLQKAKKSASSTMRDAAQGGEEYIFTHVCWHPGYQGERPCKVCAKCV